MPNTLPPRVRAKLRKVIVALAYYVQYRKARDADALICCAVEAIAALDADAADGGDERTAYTPVTEQVPVGDKSQTSKQQHVSASATVPPTASALTFAQLRAANVARLLHFKSRAGTPAHSEADGSDWSLCEWCTAVTGELGELANLLKKVKRGDFTLDAALPDIADELADVAIYLDLLAFRCGVDLGVAVREKWNRTSERVGYEGRIE